LRRSASPLNGKAVVGGPVETLVELTHRVALLVVGSRGWGPIRRILLGSTAREVDPRGRRPVLVVPRGAATGEPGEQEPTTVEVAPRTVA
jgi:universal stress protein family protein